MKRSIESYSNNEIDHTYMGKTNTTILKQSELNRYKKAMGV